MSLFKDLKEECIQIGSDATNKEEVLKEIAKLAKQCSALDNVSETDLFQALLDRENIGTTGFEKGIAIPHCKLDSISEFVVGALVIPEGVDCTLLTVNKNPLEDGFGDAIT